MVGIEAFCYFTIDRQGNGLLGLFQLANTQARSGSVSHEIVIYLEITLLNPIVVFSAPF
jgi:hypothetical protein